MIRGPARSDHCRDRSCDQFQTPTYVYNELTKPFPLTQAHLLVGKRILSIPSVKLPCDAHVSTRRLGDLSLYDEPRNRQPHTLDVEALQVVIEEDSSLTCEFAKLFDISNETFRLHMYLLRQRVAACMSLLSRHHAASIFDEVLTSDKKWVCMTIPSAPSIGCHPRNCPLLHKTIYAPMQDYALCLVDRSSSGSL
ncbi:hypothetical protein NPIL_633421 [Nephila pilipes]|uniref:Uncharacterized protein n=1 Tax=Nephila pilipes TaxID=299642 RepID=A0A8X6JSJ2_NEPPI|nr:hypothetical protein NPIL_633421 [Nephila pilipes]